MDGTMGDLQPQRDGGEGAELRGRRAFAGDGTLLGQVTDVLADRGGAPQYVAVSLEAPVARQQGGKRVFVPFRGARLDDTGRVHLDEVTGASAAALPTEPTSAPLDAEATVLDLARAADAEVGLPVAASDRVGTLAGEARMVLSEEELRLHKQVVPAGEVVVHKEVVEEVVRQSVPVMHEDVDVERRPVPPGAGLEPRMEGDVMYVPLVREELVVTRRLVAHEELVIRKRQVTTEQVVEETVRREEARVERPGDGGARMP